MDLKRWRGPSNSIAQWTPKMEAELRRLWPKMSAHRIALALFSPEQRERMREDGRNAVIGKASRMGLRKAVRA